MVEIILGEADKEGDGIIISNEKTEIEYDREGMPTIPVINKGIRLSAENVTIVGVKPMSRLQHLKAIFVKPYEATLGVSETGFAIYGKLERIDDSKDGYIRVSNYRKEEQA